MKINYCEQQSKEWFQAKVGKIGGTRFGAATSGKKNRLVYELMNEVLNGYIEPDEYVSDDMLFGIENEPVARKLFEEFCGHEWQQIGLIESEECGIHVASPDGIYNEQMILEIKCTQNGYIHLQRAFEGVESSYLPQIVNYFAISDDIDRVYFVSYCPDRTERPLIPFVFYRHTEVKDGKATTTIGELAKAGRARIKEIEAELADKLAKFATI